MLRLGKGKETWRRRSMNRPDKFFRLQEKEGSSIFRVDSKYLKCERYTGLIYFTEWCSMDCFFDREEGMLYYIKEEPTYYA